jgi:hypothetical protein
MKTCTECGKLFKKSSGNKKYCSRICRKRAECYEPEELLAIIKRAVKRMRRIPARRELGRGINSACIQRFGSWNKAVLAAGFIPNRSHDNRMYRRSSAKALDGHICDSVSELLIDNWLYKRKISHERDAHYPKTNCLADWAIVVKDRRMLVEYFGLARDSPRYDRTIKRKISLCLRSKIPLIAIYPTDLYPKNFLEDNLERKFNRYVSA